MHGLLLLGDIAPTLREATTRSKPGLAVRNSSLKSLSPCRFCVTRHGLAGLVDLDYSQLGSYRTAIEPRLPDSDSACSWEGHLESRSHRGGQGEALGQSWKKKFQCACVRGWRSCKAQGTNTGQAPTGGLPRLLWPRLKWKGQPTRQGRLQSCHSLRRTTDRDRDRTRIE